MFLGEVITQEFHTLVVFGQQGIIVLDPLLREVDDSAAPVHSEMNGNDHVLVCEQVDLQEVEIKGVKVADHSERRCEQLERKIILPSSSTSSPCQSHCREGWSKSEC